MLFRAFLTAQSNRFSLLMDPTLLSNKTATQKEAAHPFAQLRLDALPPNGGWLNIHFLHRRNRLLHPLIVTEIKSLSSPE